MTDPRFADGAYWDRLRAWAARHSDGCTSVADVYVLSCFQHDYCYQTGTDPYTGDPITKAESDALFRRTMQATSRLGRGSPMSWWRWAGVTWFGGRAWHDSRIHPKPGGKI